MRLLRGRRRVTRSADLDEACSVQRRRRYRVGRLRVVTPVRLAARRLHPHALRHFAATSWLRGGAGLDEVRRLLGHESLSTTLRYSSLVGADLKRARKMAGAIERLGLT